MKKRYGLLSTLALTAGLITTANATLIDRGNGMIYDSAQNLTWLQDANYAQTSNHDTDGRMTWDNATAWANNLVYQSYSDWRLPTMVDTGAPGCTSSYNGTECGFNVDTATSALAYMYDVTLGNTPYFDTSGNPAPGWNATPNNSADGVTIANLQSSFYWLGTEYAPHTYGAWYFFTSTGAQDTVNKGSEMYAWAVRSGDVAAQTNVPEPEVLGLLSLGLVGMIAARRRC